MRKKVLVVAFILLIALSASLYANSTFGIGAVGYYSYYDLEAENFENYIPGLRGDFFFSDFIGVSGDFIYLGPFFDVELATVVANVIFRLPLGMIEPYVATGPAYLMAFSDEGYEVAESAFAYNVRGGVDFNIMDSLSVGAEVNFFVQDVEDFFNTLSNSSSEEISDMIKASSLIGITAKVKF
jgi:opacity protein-like surface antigen